MNIKKKTSFLSIIFSLIIISCSRQAPHSMPHKLVEKINADSIYYDSIRLTKPPLTYKLSMQLAKCIPKDWIIWEEFQDSSKMYLAHIGKGIYDLHIRANYQRNDTSNEKNVNGKVGHKYYPEIILSVYPNTANIKSEIKFTQTNSSLISDSKISEIFGETQEFLLCQLWHSEFNDFKPSDSKLLGLRKCLKASLGVAR